MKMSFIKENERKLKYITFIFNIYFNFLFILINFIFYIFIF